MASAWHDGGLPGADDDVFVPDWQDADDAWSGLWANDGHSSPLQTPVDDGQTSLQPTAPRPNLAYSDGRHVPTLANSSSSSSFATARPTPHNEPSASSHHDRHRVRLSQTEHRGDWLHHTTASQPPRIAPSSPPGLLDFSQVDRSLRFDTGEESDAGDFHFDETDRSAMAPATRRRSAVDLTDDTDTATPLPAPRREPSSLLRAAATDPSHRQPNTLLHAATVASSSSFAAADRHSAFERPAKRARLATSDNTRPRRHESPPRVVEHLDLTGDESEAATSLAQTIALQQAHQEQHTKQQSSLSGPQPLGQRQCIICMEPFTDATTTHCGHMYCHECLTQALLAGERASERTQGSCPVCRKPVSRRKAHQMVPIAFMKRSAFEAQARA